MRRMRGTSGPTSSFRALLVVRRWRRGEGVSCRAVEFIGTWVSANHLEAHAGEARLQLARDLLKRFSGDLQIRRLQRRDACTQALHRTVCACSGPLLQVSKR